MNETMLRTLALAAAVLTLAACGTSQNQSPPSTSTPSANDDRGAFRDLYRELIETNTTASQGSCTEAAQKMANRLKAAGYTDKDLVLFNPPDHPKDGGLVATLNSAENAGGPIAKPILLLAHIDVVEAKREDWKRDPFTLAEENGYFYARGAEDDKAMAAIFVDSLIRYRTEKFVPKVPIRVALTCGEEGGGQVNGAEWLHQNRPELIDAQFVVNEGAGGDLNEDNTPILLEIQAGQKIYQDFTLEVTDEGGHSSQPGAFNAIQALGAGLNRLAAAPFPVRLNDVTRAYFTAQAPLQPEEVGQAMSGIVANPQDSAAAAVLSRNPLYNAMLRTTCVPTKIAGGHANNALPQRATANVNCRILPDGTAEATQQAIVTAINDPKVMVKPAAPFRTNAASVPPLTPQIVDPIKAVAGSMWPGVPLVPTMSTGATDAIYFGKTPVYGLSGIFAKPGETHAHGLDERIQVKSLYDGRAFLYQVIKQYANGA
ncbi:M20/M25/M40 family metallo-hydrolase [Mycobacterium sp. CBMA271]|uniref:M20/M25/M40 family metallo-hydrolase n=1 Tax=unclassified Mycobacteroides TaxID=2618759 RepID=UPI0012DEB60B|nr:MULTISPECIES: M20/M25/M40 family metallo-hydrolase [unclassified Mycobacteroides]MUM17781.1 peptidase M20 [Mycobacteroides sp. CBMA 326]MUM22945.1 M20/M25/M40 family metallo-hydrolase [Mycobacteroides sp. CBMA 271]